MAEQKEQAEDRGDDVVVEDPKSAQDLADEVEKPEKEEKEDEVSEPDDKPEKGEPRIPKRRMDEVIAKSKKKDEEIAMLKERLEVRQVDSDLDKLELRIDELDDKYEELMSDGQVAEAKTVRKELRKLQKIWNNSVATFGSEAASVKAVDQMRYDTTLAVIEQEYPVLNPDADEYDEDQVNEIGHLIRKLSSGREAITRADALRRAVRYVLGPPANNGNADAVRSSKREEAVKRGLDTSKRQPASLASHGIDSDKIGSGGKKVDVMKLTHEQFKKLDEDTISRLRGDEI